MTKDEINKLEINLLSLALTDYNTFSNMINFVNKKVIYIKEESISKKDTALYDIISSLELKGRDADEYKFITRIRAMKEIFQNDNLTGHSNATQNSFNQFHKLYLKYKSKKGDITSWSKMMGYCNFFQKLDKYE